MVAEETAKHSQRSANPRTAFLTWFTALAAIYAAWLFVSWPGVIGNDSMAVLLEITRNDFSSGKTAMWVAFVRLALSIFHEIGYVVALQMLVAALVFSRVIGHIHTTRGIAVAALMAAFFTFTPHVLMLAGMLYPDGLFAICGVGLLFEVWICLKRKKISAFSAIFIIMCMPFALFARTNGIVLLIPLAYLLIRTDGRSKLVLLAISSFWIISSAVLVTQQAGRPQGAVFPLTIFETANFLQPHPFSVAFGLPAFHVSPATLDVIERNGGVEKFNEWYDRDYWDSLVHQPASPQVLGMSEEDRKIIAREFFRHNLWHNIPAFAASRVNVFLVSALAQGHFPTEAAKNYVLGNFNSHHTPLNRPKQLVAGLDNLNAGSWNFRWILWSPFIGIIMLAIASLAAIRERNIDALVIYAPLIIQLLAIFTFSIAGEYRYLFIYFLVPLIILPISYNRSRPVGESTKSTRELRKA